MATEGVQVDASTIKSLTQVCCQKGGDFRIRKPLEEANLQKVFWAEVDDAGPQLKFIAEIAAQDVTPGYSGCFAPICTPAYA